MLYVCVNFYTRVMEPKVDFERQISEKLFMTIFFIYSQSLCQKSAERQLPKKYFLIFHLVGDA